MNHDCYPFMSCEDIVRVHVWCIGSGGGEDVDCQELEPAVMTAEWSAGKFGKCWSDWAESVSAQLTVLSVGVWGVIWLGVLHCQSCQRKWSDLLIQEVARPGRGAGSGSGRQGAPAQSWQLEQDIPPRPPPPPPPPPLIVIIWLNLTSTFARFLFLSLTCFKGSQPSDKEV